MTDPVENSVNLREFVSLSPNMQVAALSASLVESWGGTDTGTRKLTNDASHSPLVGPVARREVVLDRGVLHRVAQQLPSAGSMDEPTFTDFLLYVLPNLFHILRESFDETTLTAEREGVRVLVSYGVVFRSMTTLVKLDEHGRVHIADLVIEPFDTSFLVSNYVDLADGSGNWRNVDRLPIGWELENPSPLVALTLSDLDSMTPDERSDVMLRAAQPLAESEISPSLKERIEATSARLARRRVS